MFGSFFFCCIEVFLVEVRTWVLYYFEKCTFSLAQEKHVYYTLLTRKKKNKFRRKPIANYEGFQQVMCGIYEYSSVSMAKLHAIKTQLCMGYLGNWTKEVAINCVANGIQRLRLSLGLSCPEATSGLTMRSFSLVNDFHLLFQFLMTFIFLNILNISNTK